MRTPIVPLVLLLLLPTFAAADVSIPDADSIQKQIIAAAGHAPDNSRSTVAIAHGDEVRIERTWRLGHDLRRDVVDGPFETQNGVYAGQVWRQNENGITVLFPKEPGNERRVAYQTSVRRITEPVTGYVLSNLDPEGFGDRSYIDGVTWRIVRREYLSRNATTTYVYDDFRTVNGYTRAYHWTTSDGHPENTTESRVTEDAAGVATPADVKIPGFRRELLTFPDGTDRVDLPARMDGSRIIVRAMVGKRGLDFELDSGASGITLDSSVASELGLKLYGRRSVVTAQRYQAGRSIIPLLSIGPFALHDLAVNVIPSLNERSSDTKVVGLLGFDFLAQAEYKIDYQNARVTAYPKGKYAAPGDAGTIPLDVRLTTGQPLVTAAINGYSADRFVLDTGGEGTFMLFDYFVRRYPDALKKGTFGGDDARMQGVGGAFATRRYRATVSLGKVDFTDVDGYVVTSAGSFDAPEDGLIGSSFLRLFDVWLDYATSHVYLVPNAAGRNVGA